MGLSPERGVVFCGRNCGGYLKRVFICGVHVEHAQKSAALFNADGIKDEEFCTWIDRRIVDALDRDAASFVVRWRLECRLLPRAASPSVDSIAHPLPTNLVLLEFRHRRVLSVIAIVEVGLEEAVFVPHHRIALFRNRRLIGGDDGSPRTLSFGQHAHKIGKPHGRQEHHPCPGYGPPVPPLGAHSQRHNAGQEDNCNQGQQDKRHAPPFRK